MAALSKKPYVFQKVAGFLLSGALALLTACGGSHQETGATGSNNLALVASQLHAKGDEAGAANFYSRAVQQSPDNTRIRQEFGEVLESQGDLNGAVLQYRAALGFPVTESPQSLDPKEITSDNTDLLRDYGRVLVKLGKPGEAQPVYARALQIDPDDVRLLNGLGVSLDQLNNHEAAQKVYKEALDNKANDFTTLANLGHSYVLSGAYEAAIKLLEPHLNDPSVTPALRQNLAEAYGMNGMDADAERVSRIDLTPMQVKHNLAYYRSHRAQSASGTSLFADLGHFPTEEMARVHAEEVRTNFPKETEGLTVAATPVVTTIGGTPSFTVHVTGFEKTGTLQTFCLKLKRQQISCTSRIGLE